MITNDEGINLMYFICRRTRAIKYIPFLLCYWYYWYILWGMVSMFKCSTMRYKSPKAQHLHGPILKFCCLNGLNGRDVTLLIYFNSIVIVVESTLIGIPQGLSVEELSRYHLPTNRGLVVAGQRHNNHLSIKVSWGIFTME